LHAQESAATSASVEGGTAVQPAPDDTLDRWWIGGYYRHLWVPGYITDPFFSSAPAISNDGFGLVATYRTLGSLNIEMGVGYMPYSFHGPFLADGKPIEDTELVRSDLKFWHLTGSLMWDIEFHRTVALEIGVGLDLGLFSGDVIRNSAYLDGKTGRFKDCTAPLMPAAVGPNGIPYCEVPKNGGKSDKPGDNGELYDQRENRWPTVMAFPMLPHVALRLQPFKHLTIKGEFAFGIAQMFAGVSLHVSFGLLKAGPKEVFDKQPEPPPANGRVLGKVLDASSGAPIGGATVRVLGRALSPLSTEADGRFIVDRLDPGMVMFQLEHGDYASSKCRAEIPERGGDVALDCQLTPKARVGAVSGQLVNEDGTPIPNQIIQLFGPRNETVTSDDRGLFAAVDLPAGTYRIRVEADDYLVQMVEVVVESQNTAMPQIILIKKPKRSLVELRKQEIVIAEQVQFAPKSADIVAASESLLRQVVDVLLRHPQIELVEIQGHTDSTGSHELNMTLSQQRADSVRTWLVKAGVAPERLEAKGYGPDHPIAGNDTPQSRARNRRVQFIIRTQAAEVVEPPK
jgi:outer membrane protein OmpA-like peptidoglycan-associated protein